MQDNVTRGLSKVTKDRIFVLLLRDVTVNNSLNFIGKVFGCHRGVLCWMQQVYALVFVFLIFTDF